MPFLLTAKKQHAKSYDANIHMPFYTTCPKSDMPFYTTVVYIPRFQKMCTFSLKKVPRIEKVCRQAAMARRKGALLISLITPRLKRLRQCLPSYLAGAPASVGALSSEDRKNVQSAGLIHRISTRLFLCCGLTQAVIAPGNYIACSSSKITCMQAN